VSISLTDKNIQVGITVQVAGS